MCKKIKTLKDFNYDYKAYANYLESAECANDNGYDILVDVPGGNIYERTDGDWTKGHGHKNVKNGYDRDKDSESSKNRKWKNPWFIYIERLNLTPEEILFLQNHYNDIKNKSNDKAENSSFVKKLK